LLVAIDFFENDEAYFEAVLAFLAYEAASLAAATALAFAVFNAFDEEHLAVPNFFERDL
jgi:hypothetical protein